MLIEIGPRKIGRCELRYDGCTAKGFNIVKMILVAKDGRNAWACQKCLYKQAKLEREELSKRCPRESSA